MSNSTSQVQQEIISLTSHVKTLEIGISSSPEPRSITHPYEPRLLSLSPYKRATSFFDHWDEHTEYPIMPSPTTPDKDTQHDDIGILSDSQISHFELDESESEPEEEFDIFEDAENRVLGALRCYYFNLGMGMLVTGEKVDKDVSNAVQKIMDMSQGDFGALKSSERMNLSRRPEGGEPSDEERMVAELEWYLGQVRSHESKPAPDVVDVARKVLQWAAERRIVKDGSGS
ncbi:hypothetical protein DL95DRAFT_407473 [Leptodontidium sp. 2 PMI_412]|nr:hypothetical protein DL95DRAFT_407473 [Leptodontidium sp. 2 PMI_412]